MSEKGSPINASDPIRETEEVWEQKADFWDGRMGEDVQCRGWLK